ncbi:hypothetical protein ACBP88_05230 [Comamonas jiangduensis]|uniref:Uncharacterized protein n=1 Tax=Comamonas jiangduensis TaxID=1194168 RepID=A0ABV4IAR6_9BURK
MDLPGQAWVGRSFYGGKLWSPEGRSFNPVDASWLGLLVRRAHAFEYYRQRVGQEASRTALGKLALHGVVSEAPTLYLSHRHFGTRGQQTEAASGFRVRYDLNYQPLFNARKELP